MWDTEPHFHDNCCWPMIMRMIFNQSNPRKKKRDRVLKKGDLELAALNYLVCDQCNDFYKIIIFDREKNKRYFAKRR